MKRILYEFLLSGYRHKKYWQMRLQLQKKDLNIIIRLIYLFRCRRMEVKQNASTGLRLSGGVVFEEAPILIHGLNGIFVAPYAHVGKNVTIFQQVTIGIKAPGEKVAPRVGDNVLIGAGAKIIGDITIGNNVKIGANAVVTKSVPNGCTVVGNPARIITSKTNP